MPTPDDPRPALTRRDILRLGAAVGALGLGLGLGTTTPVEATEPIFVKVELPPDAVFMKTYKISENESPRPQDRAELLHTVDLTRDFSSRAVMDGKEHVMIKLYAVTGSNEQVLMESNIQISPQKQHRSKTQPSWEPPAPAPRRTRPDTFPSTEVRPRKTPPPPPKQRPQ